MNETKSTQPAILFNAWHSVLTFENPESQASIEETKVCLASICRNKQPLSLNGLSFYMD